VHPHHGFPFLSVPQHPVLSAIWAVLAHGLVSVLIVLPLVRHSEKRLWYGALAFIGANAFDLDHAVVAGSVNLRALEQLGRRPDTHGLAFAALLTVVAFAVTRRGLVAWSVFAIVFGHVLWDSAGGGDYWLFPLKHPDSVPWLACPVGTVVLMAISAALAARRGAPLLPDAHAVDEHAGGQRSGGIGRAGPFPADR
jgi:hypothetical protein